MRGEFCTGYAVRVGVRGEFYTESGAALGSCCRAFAAHGHCGRVLRAPGVLHAGGDGGFALHEAFLRRVAGVSDPRVVQFPPIGDGAAAVRGGVAPKVQTTSVKNAENGLLVAKWSAFWRIRCLSWCVGCT